MSSGFDSSLRHEILGVLKLYNCLPLTLASERQMRIQYVCICHDLWVYRQKYRLSQSLEAYTEFVRCQKLGLLRLGDESCRFWFPLISVEKCSKPGCMMSY